MTARKDIESVIDGVLVDAAASAKKSIEPWMRGFDDRAAEIDKLRLQVEERAAYIDTMTSQYLSVESTEMEIARQRIVACSVTADDVRMKRRTIAEFYAAGVSPQQIEERARVKIEVRMQELQGLVREEKLALLVDQAELARLEKEHCSSKVSMPKIYSETLRDFANRLIRSTDALWSEERAANMKYSEALNALKNARGRHQPQSFGPMDCKGLRALFLEPSLDFAIPALEEVLTFAEKKQLANFCLQVDAIGKVSWFQILPVVKENMSGSKSFGVVEKSVEITDFDRGKAQRLL